MSGTLVSRAFGGIEKAPAPLRELLPILAITDLTGPSPNLLAAAIAIEQKTAAFVEGDPVLPSEIDELIPADTIGEPYDPTKILTGP